MRRHSWKHALSILAWAVSIGVVPLSAATQSCKLIPDSIRIDGVLDEPFWKQIDTLTMVRNNDPAGGTPSVATKVLVAWSRTNLYVAMIADTRDIKGIITQHDTDIYDEDALEMFLDPDGDGKNYLEFEWNCLNTSYDNVFAAPRSGGNLDWSPAGIRSAVKLHGTANKSSDIDTGWVLEISLPWSAVQPFSKAALPPRIGDTLALNFYRIDHASEKEELIAWTPVGVADFHRPDKFGSLIFSASSNTGVRSPHAGFLRTSRAAQQARARQARLGFPYADGPESRSEIIFDANGRNSWSDPIPLRR